MDPIDEHIRTYLVAIAVEGKTQRTIESYSESLGDFRRVGRELGLPKRTEDFAVANVYEFLGAVKARGGSAGYQNRRHREVRAFFSWCRRMGFVDENVFARVPLARQQKKVRLPFTTDDVTKLLARLDRTTGKGSRDYALVLFLLDTGVRVAECFSVQLADVDWEEGRVLVQGKGQKQRYVGVSLRTSEALRGYVESFRGKGPGPIFLTRERMPFADPNALRVVLRRIAERAGVEGVHPHRFRRTFATWAIESGAHETDVMLLLGHTTLAMTHHYAQTYTSQQALRAHAALSPVGRLPR